MPRSRPQGREQHRTRGVGCALSCQACNPYVSPWVLKCRELEREAGGEVLGSGDAARSRGDFKLFFGPQYWRSPQLTSDSPGMIRFPCLCSQEQKAQFSQEHRFRCAASFSGYASSRAKCEVTARGILLMPGLHGPGREAGSLGEWPGWGRTWAGVLCPSAPISLLATLPQVPMTPLPSIPLGPTKLTLLPFPGSCLRCLGKAAQ